MFDPKYIIMGVCVWGTCVASAVLASDAPLSNLTLIQAYKLALVRSETIAIKKEVINEAKGRFWQALSTALPQIAYQESEKWQDRSTDKSVRARTPLRAFTFTQPLFSGFREFAAVASSNAEGKQRKEELVRAKHILFTDVSDAYYFFKSYQEELNILKDIDKALTDRNGELKKRESLGRSRSSEIASTEARFYNNEAEIESLFSQQEVARQLLEFLVGARVGSLANEDLVVPDVAALSVYEAKAMMRPDVKAAGQASMAAQKNITAARSGYWPTVDAVGNRYVKRTGSSADVDWDITLNINVPLFTGGETWGQVKEAKAKALEAQLRYAQTQRLALLDIQNAYTRLIAGQKRTAAYQKAVEAAQKNYDLQGKDYGNSLVNNLDVLQSLEDLQTVKRNYVSVKNETQRAFWALKTATGDIADDAL